MLQETCLIVTISSRVDALVLPMHYSDARLKHPSRRFKNGGSVKARVSTTYFIRLDCTSLRPRARCSPLIKNESVFC